ncbi:ATPase PAAT isoform X2 [Clupea harengus]|uniref:ATPase PAAT isoform X2 n=1 Tax=Clupea harengus TaxID=7950 RepID=A0A6P8FDC7_CLUHA|nr:ATPase PAAT isoform X2 [Clupea harengus]
MSEQMKTSKDGVISGSISWVSRLEDCHICDVIKTHQEGNLQQVDTEVQSNNAPQYLEQVDATPCVITLQCVPHCRSVITSLLVVSEARTMEVYSASGDYCGTCRGEQDSNVNCDGVTDSRPFYRKHLKLECPTTSCEVKLLSLGGRASVGIAGIHVALRVLEAEGKQEVGTGGSIDLKQVQTMMEEMGTTLSPGAQHLMDMVQFQQKDNASLTETSAQGDYGHRSCQAPTSSPSPRSTLLPTPAPLPAGLSQGKLQEVMSALMRAPPGQHCAATPDLLPLLQSVCCQVAQLRMDDTTAATIAQGKAHMPNGPSEVHPCCRGLEEVLEKRLQQMEDRLREHMDQRLDSLEQKLDTVLQQVLLPPMQPS